MGHPDGVPTLSVVGLGGECTSSWGWLSLPLSLPGTSHWMWGDLQLSAWQPGPGTRQGLARPAVSPQGRCFLPLCAPGAQQELGQDDTALRVHQLGAHGPGSMPDRRNM